MGGCKSVLCLILILWTSEFDLYNSLLVTANKNGEIYIYISFFFIYMGGYLVFQIMYDMNLHFLDLLWLIIFFYLKDIITVGLISPDNYTIHENGMTIRKRNHP
jgi:hypothetical protein